MTAGPGAVEYVVATAQQVGDALRPTGVSGSRGIPGDPGIPGVPFGMDTLLSAGEKAAAARFRNDADRNGYRTAHVLFRLMAARYLNLSPGDGAHLRVLRRCRSCGGDHGKPGIEGVDLSLSRSADVVMVAASPAGQPIGADIERIPGEVFAGFDAYALAPSESRPLADTDAAARIRLWVAKEAALKTTGHGLAIEPAALEVRTPHTEAPRFGTTCGWATAAVRSPAHAGHDGMKITWVPSAAGHESALAGRTIPAVRQVGLDDLLR